ncbi:hypothetical protein [Actinoplanes sp. NPDC051411]|uniref:hypothetical protein n=1 Tax=Actinoplanes sp. NPDC051411 TaxID=3155522 RepID=UPI0034218666
MGRLGSALERASVDAGLVERHIRVNADLPPLGEGMIQTLMMLHERAYPWGQGTARQISAQAGQVANGVREATKMYHNTDRSAAAMMDNTYDRVQLPDMFARRPGVPPNFVGPTPITLPPASFADVAEPEDALHASLAFDHPDFQAKFNWMTDTLSPSAIVRSVVQAVFHKDIFAFFLKDISGDWNALYDCGTVWYQAAGAVRNISNNLVAHATHLPTVWSGNAADGCELYLLQLDAATYSDVAMYEYTGQAYHEAAKGAWTQFELAASLLGDALDACVAIGAAVGAGIATSETIIGAIAGTGTAGWYAWRAWKAYESATEIMDETQKMLERFVNSVTVIEATGRQLTRNPPSVLPFPAAPYRFPGA